LSARKRVSLSVRLQPYSDSLLAEVVNWLNSLDKGEANRLIGEALLMAYLPYARAMAGEDREEIERCCWETTDRLNSHGFMMRQALRVAQPQFTDAYYNRPVVDSLYSEAVVKSNRERKTVSKSEPTQPNAMQSRLSEVGSASEVSSVFGDDD
jgi:hypothetical protein